MHLSKLLLALPLIVVTSVYAQETPSVTVGTARNELRIKLDLQNTIPRSEVIKLQQIGNYDVHEMVRPEELAGRIASEVERISLLPDGPDKKTQLDNLAARLKNPLPNLVNAANPPTCFLDCARIILSLNSTLDYDKTYELKIAGVVIQGNALQPVEFKIEKTASIVESLNASNTREELRIRSTGPLDIAAPGNLSIQRKTLRINAEGSRVENHIDNLAAVASQPSNSPNLIEVKLDQKLNEAQAHTLSIPGGPLTDGTGIPIAAKGTITIPGLPSASDDPTLSFGFDTNAAVGAKPQFDFDLMWAPYKKYILKRPSWFWQPNVKVDVGLGDTKSDNAVSLALFAHYSSNPSNLARLPTSEPGLQSGESQRTPSEVQLTTYYRWRKTPWYRLGSYDFFIGPKMEADRAFNRINALGTVRFDLRFHRWIATIDEKRKLLKPQLRDMADLVEINNGFRFIPYVLFDFGGNVRSETVENKDKMLSITVPRHSIFRSHLGIKGLLQWRLFSFPMTLTLEEHFMHLATREDIAFVTDEGVELRSLRGFHHHGEAAWNLAFDPAKHFNFTVTYENGRSAPNFEYLNKLSTGFKVIF
jgi:hypothetical protein